MLNNRNPWLLAAGVVVATAATLGSLNPAMAITSVEELKDAKSSHWAYEALRDLVEKYDVIEGYPDYTFKGTKAPTRYEMAAALDALIKSVGRDLARLGAEKANKADLEALAALQDEFKDELAAVRGRVDALEARATSIEEKNAEQDSRLDLLEKTQIHGDFSFGALADVGANGTVGAGSNNGISDGISAIGRLRLGVNVPVYEGSEDGKLGEGDVVARLTAAFGRWAPQAAEAGGTNATAISGYSSIAGGTSFYNTGIFGGGVSNAAGNGTGGNTRPNLYVDLAYYKQHFKSGIPILTDLFPGTDVLPNDGLHETTADLYMGLLDWKYLFNRSPYRGDDLNQFQNSSLVNNPALLNNFVAPGVALKWNQGLGQHYSGDLTAAVQALNTSDAMAATTVTAEAGLNYDTSFLGENMTKPGRIYGGVNHAFFAGNASLPSITGAVTGRNGAAYPLDNNGQSVTGLYAGFSQELYRGIGLSGDYAYNTNGSNNAILASLRNGTGSLVNLMNNNRIVGIRQAATGVLTVPLTVFDKDLTKRAKDTIGVGYAWIDPLDYTGGQSGFSSKAEHVVEAFYRMQLTDSISLVPSAQVILNPYGVGANDTYWVFGLRANYVF